MDMLKCAQCGGNINIDDTNKNSRCPYCGTNFTKEKSKQEVIGRKSKYFVIVAMIISVIGGILGGVDSIIVLNAIFSPENVSTAIYVLIPLLAILSIVLICYGTYVLKLPDDLLLIIDGRVLTFAKSKKEIDLNDISLVSSHNAKIPSRGSFLSEGTALEKLNELPCGKIEIHMKNGKMYRQRFLADVVDIESIIDQKLKNLDKVIQDTKPKDSFEEYWRK